MTRASIITAGFGLACTLGSALACLPGSFDELAESAPVTTVDLRFPGEPGAELAVALTVSADDEGRGRVLFSDGASGLGWFRIDDGGGSGDRRFASFEQLSELGTHERPILTGLAVVEGGAVAEALVRVAGREGGPDRLVRVRVADFSRPSPPALDMVIYPWVADPPPALAGPLAAVQLDEGQSEALSGSAEGLIIWDALGTTAEDYAEAREAVLDEDPAAFEQDPAEGWGLTRCPGLAPAAIAGGRLLADDRSAAAVVEGATLRFVGAEEPPRLSSIGAPIYSCELRAIPLPGEAGSLAVVDLGRDGDDDLLVGAPTSAAVWVFVNEGQGIPDAPSFTLTLDEPTGSPDPSSSSGFGAALAVVELGGEAPEVIAVGEPRAAVEGKVAVGRVHLFDAREGELLRTLADLEPRTDSRHGLGVHGLDVPGREELVVSGARELRIHWAALVGDLRP